MTETSRSRDNFQGHVDEEGKEKEISTCPLREIQLCGILHPVNSIWKENDNRSWVYVVYVIEIRKFRLHVGVRTYSIHPDLLPPNTMFTSIHVFSTVSLGTGSGLEYLLLSRNLHP